MNTQNTHISGLTNSQQDAVLEKVADILKISEKKLEAKLESTNTPISISDILGLSEYSSNEELVFFAIEEDRDNFLRIHPKLRKNDIFIARLLLSFPSLFGFLAPEEKSQESMICSTVKGMIREKKNFLSIADFLRTLSLSSKEEEKYLTYYKNSLKELGYIYRNDIEKYLLELCIDAPELFQRLKNLAIFESKGEFVKISNTFQEICVSFLTSLNAGEENKKEIFFEKIFSTLAITQKVYKQKYISLWDMLYEETFTQIQIQEFEIPGEEEKEDSQTPEKENLSVKLEYALVKYPAYTVTSKSCQIYYKEGKTIEISSQEMENMTLKALENYLDFLRIFDDLGLSFLSEKYRDQFLRITDIHYDLGEGISEGKLLRLLNFLGRNIGVPEKSYQNEQGEETTGSFQTLAGAKLAFREIKETGHINENYICSPSERGDYAICEIYLREKGLIDTQGRGLNIMRWN